MTKFEFGSPDWIEALRRIFAEAFSAAPDRATVAFSISERYLDPPPHLADTPLGWHCRFADGAMDFSLGASTHVDVYIEADYEAVLPVSRLVFGAGDPANRRPEVVGALVADGKLTMHGDMGNQPSFMEGVHDAIAVLTE